MRRLVTIVIASAMLIAPAGARAAFLPPNDTPGGSAPQVSASADGSAVLTYLAGDKVMLATKQPGEFFGAATQLGTGYNVALATAPSGQGIIAWTQANGTVRAALRPAGGGTFTAITATIGTSITSAAANLTPIEVAISSTGRLYLAFDTTTTASLTTFAAGSSKPINAITIATPNAPTGLAIAPISSADGAYLVATVTSGLNNATYAKRWSSAIGAGTQQTLATNTGHNTSGSGYGDVLSYRARTPLAVLGPHAAIFWVSFDTSSSDGSFTTSTRGVLMRADEPFTSPPVVVDSDSGQDFDRADITAPASTTDASGAVTVTWAHMDFGGAIKQIVRPTPAAAFGLPTELTGLTSLLDDASVTDVAPTSIGGGAAQVTYSALNTAGIPSTLYTAPATATGALAQAEPTVLAPAVGTDDDVQPVASGTGSGDTVVAWTHREYSPVRDTLQVEFSDVTPPTLSLNDATTTQAVADTVDASNPTAVAAAQTFTFDATASDLWTPTIVTWDFGDGTTATGSSVTHRFTAAGTATITATATDAAGNKTSRTTSRRVPTVVTPAATPPPGVPVASPTPTATPAPVIASGLKLSRTKFGVVKTKPSKSAGAKATFTLSAAVPRVEIAVRLLVRGYRSGTGCVVKRATKKAKRCTTSLALGFAGTPAGVAGKNTFALTGKAAGKTLKPGKYMLTVTPVNALQSQRTIPITATFTITA